MTVSSLYSSQTFVTQPPKDYNTNPIIYAILGTMTYSDFFYSSQTFVTQLPKDLFKKNSAIYSLGDLTPNTFCAMLLYLLAYR